MRIVVALFFVVVTIAGLQSCAHHAIEPGLPGSETCSPMDAVSCAVQCDEGVATACEKTKAFGPHLLDEAGQVKAAALEEACADGHPNACARVALGMAERGYVEAAYHLVEPRCRQNTWYACDVAATINARRPLPPGPFSPWKVVDIVTPAQAGPGAPQAYPRAAFQQRSEGVSHILVGVRRDGSIARLRVLQSAGAALDAHALFAVRRLTWQPARNAAGEPVDSLVRYRVRFEMAPDL